METPSLLKYTCTVCSQRFFTSEDLVEHHLLRHADEHETVVWEEDNSSNIYNRPSITTAQTEYLDSSLTEIPISSLLRIGAVFTEGHAKYGKHNWRTNPTREFVIERINHAIYHLHTYAQKVELGESSNEDDLAKVGWAVVVLCELELRNSNIFYPVINPINKKVN